MSAKHLVIFDLPSVVSYDHLPLRKALIEAIQQSLDLKPKLQDIEWSQNCRGILRDVYHASAGSFPTVVEEKLVQLDFNKRLKQYFLSQEDTFEVWPGIQNIFGSLTKKKDWDFVLISDYWLDSTRFILDSCGVFSRHMQLFTAEDAWRSSHTIARIGNEKEREGGEVLYLLSREKLLEEIPGAATRWKQVKLPRLSSAKSLEYPRFSQLFTTS